jgi:hypothetical protein
MSLDRHSVLMVRTYRSAKAFRFGVRVGSIIGCTPPERSMARKEVQNFVSLSCKANRTGSGAPSMASTALRAICIIHSSVDLVIPAMLTWRVSKCKRTAGNR